MSYTVKNRYAEITRTKEGRSFLWNLVNDNCSFDLTEGATIRKETCEFDLGKLSICLKIQNEITKFCPKVLDQMDKEKNSYGEY